jgi:hypothetical protein
MSRSIFCALAHADGDSAWAVFLQQLAQHAKSKSPRLASRLEELAKALQPTPANIQFDLQAWPPARAFEDREAERLLIGISSSHATGWTFGTRAAPSSPCADAWIYVPGHVLIVFEFKNDAHSLDATQVSAYLHALGLVTENDGVPKAEPRCHLEDSDQAKRVQDKCKGKVLDLPWQAVIGALKKIGEDERTGIVGRWLSMQAAAYIASHVRPPYQGVGTILDWLGGPNTDDRRFHLRTLIQRMGAALASEPAAISFARHKSGKKWEIFRGVSSAGYVRLCRGEHLIERRWLGKSSRLNLWFQFNEDVNQRMGLDFWVEAPGVVMTLRTPDKVAAWNAASERCAAAAKAFEDAMANWVRSAPDGTSRSRRRLPDN